MEKPTYLIPAVIFLILFAVLVWDLHRVKEISDVIHDDHHKFWIPMKPSEVSKWYNDYDMCKLKSSLNSSSNNIVPSKILSSFNKTCGKSTFIATLVSLRYKCSIGSSIGNRQCNQPLIDKKYYLQRLMNDKYYDPSNEHLKSFLLRLAKKKKPLVFLGDVISKQNFDALICESIRSDKVWIKTNENLNNTQTSFTMHWRGERHSLLILFLHMTHILTHPTSGSASHDSAYDHDRTYHVENSDSFENDVSRTSNGNITHIRKKKYRILKGETFLEVNYPKQATSLELDQVNEYLKKLNDTYGGLVIVANVGVWYNTRERFRTEAPLLLHTLNTYAQTNIVLFRETAAQHWNLTKTGYFPNGGDPTMGACAPVVDSSPEYDWRNRDIRLIIDNEGYHNIDVIPFRDITTAIWQMHPDDRNVKDCTRLCYFPQLWQKVWYHLDIASYNSTKLR